MYFNSLTHKEKEKLCDIFEAIVQVAISQGTSIQHIREMINYTEDTWPGFKEYRLARFKKNCPTGQVFRPYMPIIEEGENSENH